MGNAHSGQNQQLSKNFVRSDWNLLLNRGLYQIWQNKKTNQICEAYNIQHVPNQKSLEHYRFRHDNQNASYFVSIRYLSIQQNKTLCSTGQSYVLTEYIPVKLSDMKSLTLAEGFSLLRASFCGFNTIEAFHGPFSPSEELIGVNLKGKPKIWINRDHSKDSVQKVSKARIWQKHQNQISENVRKVLELIEQKLEAKKFPNQFRPYFYDNILNYFQAYQFVEEYCQKRSIQIPEHIDSLRHVEEEQIKNIITQYQRKEDLPEINYTKSIGSLHQKHDNQVFTHQNTQNFKNMMFNSEPQPQIVYEREKRLSKVFFNYPSEQAMPMLQRVSTLPLINTFHVNSRPVQRINQPSQEHNKYNIVNVHLSSPVTKIMVNNNLTNEVVSTPQHIGDNFKFKSPHRITEFKKPLRQIITRPHYSPQSKQLITIAESKYCGQAITEIMDEKNKNQKLDRSYHEELPQEYSQQKQNGSLHKYIKQEQQISDYQVEESLNNQVSEPDWSKMQQNQVYGNQPDEYSDGLNSEEEIYHQQQLEDVEGDSASEEVQEQQSSQMQTGNEESNNDFGEECFLNGEVIESNLQIENAVYTSQDQDQNQQSQREEYEFKFSNSGQPFHGQNQLLQSENQSELQENRKTVIIHESQQNIYHYMNKAYFNNNLPIEAINKTIQSQSGLVVSEERPSSQLSLSYQSKLLEMKKLALQYPIQTQDQAGSQSLVSKYQGLHFRNQSDQLYQYCPSSSNQHFVSNIQSANSDLNSVQQITKLQSQKQIEDYIKNKYSHMFIQPEIKHDVGKKRNSREERTMTFAKKSEVENCLGNNSGEIQSRPSSKNIYKKQVEFMMGSIQSQYYKPLQAVCKSAVSKASNEGISRNFIDNDVDVLDVKNLQKNLDSKYKNAIGKTHEKNKSSNIFSDQDGFNVAFLDQKLQKFQQNRQILGKSQDKSQQAKIGEKQQNFSQYDNFVQMMDKKIQESQSRAKIGSSRSIAQNQLNSKYEIDKNPLYNALNNINYPLNSIPSLKKNSRHDSTLDMNLKMVSVSDRYKFDSDRDSGQDYSSRKQNTVDKVFSFSKKVIESSEQQIHQNAYQRKRVSIRLSAAQDANKLAEQIEKKYKKHVYKQSSFNENQPNNKLFLKKKQSNTLYLPSENKIMVNYAQSQAVDTHYRRNSTNYKTVQDKKSNDYLNLPIDGNLQSDNTLSSNRKSNQASKKILGMAKRSSKVSYEQLRDLLWQ